jgi:hypothetical protein
MTAVNDNTLIPEVLADIVRGALPTMEVFGSTGAMTLNFSLPNGSARLGDKVKVPYFGTLGAWRELSAANDGVLSAITADSLADTVEESTVKHFYKVTELTKWARNSASGDKAAEAARQMVEGARLRIQASALVAALDTTAWGSYILDESTKIMSVDTLIGAQALLKEEAGEWAAFVCNSAVKFALYKLKDSTGRHLLGDPTPAAPAGTICGIPIVMSDALTIDTGVYTSLLMKKGSLVGWFDGANVSVETMREVQTDKDITAAHLYGCVHRYKRMPGGNYPGVVHIKTKVA